MSDNDEENKIVQAVTLLDDGETDPSNYNYSKIDLNPGDKVGPYHILEEIGNGGMGVVFLVEQKIPVRRKLALKVIKLGMDTKDVLARFELERQVLALMSHPNVASVIDAGMTKKGRPYFVMEYVPGIPITEYADKYSLSIEDRIKLVIQACKGVFHAHQKGILHRDIKPGNVLVMEVDRVPLVKIIDFSVAKSTQQKLVNETVHTKLGVFIGTPSYTSPEQAGSSQLDIDTRTDVYSIGMILYKLMVGKLPFDEDTFSNKSILEVQKIIQEKNAPTPFTRLKTTRMARKSIVNQRRSSYSSLKKTLKGDLDCIIMHAIEKDRIERYASVGALADDLRRFLKGQPVEAQPHTTLYKVSRFIKRHKLMVLSIVTVVTALSIALVISLNALKNAKRESAKAAAVSSLIQSVLVNASPWNKSYRDEITLKSVITELEKKLDNNELLNGIEFNEARKLGLENELLWTLRESLGNLHASVGNFNAAEENILKAINLHKSNHSNEKLKLITLDLKLSKILASLGQLDSAEDIFLLSIAKIDIPKNIKQAEVYLTAKGLYRAKGELEEAVKFDKKKLAIAEEFFGKISNQYIKQLLNLVESVSGITDRNGLKKGLEYAKQARRLSHQITPKNKELEIRARSLIINILMATANSKQALKEAKEMVEWSSQEYGKNHLRTIKAELLLSYAYLWEEDASSSLVIIHRIESILRKLVKKDFYILEKLAKFKSQALIMLDRYPEALIEDEQNLSKALRDSNIANIKFFAAQVARSAYFTGDFVKAQLSIEQAVSRFKLKKGWNVSVNYSEYAQILLANNKINQAIEYSNKSILADNSNAVARTVLGFAAYKNNDFDTAISYLRKAIETQGLKYGTNSEDYRLQQANLTIMLCLSGNIQEALRIANSIKYEDSDSLFSAATKLAIMASQSINNQEVNIDIAKSLYQKIDKHWAKSTQHNDWAHHALKLILARHNK